MTAITLQEGGSYGNKTWLKELFPGAAYNRRAFGAIPKMGQIKNILFTEFK